MEVASYLDSLDKVMAVKIWEFKFLLHSKYCHHNLPVEVIHKVRVYVNKDVVLVDNCAFVVVHNSAVASDDAVLDSYGEVHSVA